MRFLVLGLGLVACSDHGINEIDKPKQGANETGLDTGFRPVEALCPVDETWKLPESQATDLLFSLDSSCSMTEDIWELSNNFDAFVNELTNFSEDWQMMVVNSDTGCSHSGILKPSSGNYSQRFKDALFAWNMNDDFTEALLTVNARAVEETGAGGCNQGFLRQDAMLHIIDISDEPEQSEQKTGETWDVLVDRIVAQKGDPALTTISAVAGDVPDGCQDAAAGTGYAEAVDATGGVFLSICPNWSSTSSLGMLAAASVNQDTFYLTQTPENSDIEVWVNSVKNQDWVYDAALNALVFQSAPLQANDNVHVRYKVTCPESSD